MKCAIIGCGRIAVNHVKAVANNDLDLVALCDIDDSKFDIMLEKAGCGDFPEAERYADYHQMLEEHPEIELVAIATESGKHAAIALDCIDAGKNLIIEKPMAMSIADADEVWIMDMVGKGKKDKGAVWVARRVPDGYISGHANHPRIHTFPLKDKNKETIYSPDVIKFAREQGYFDGKDADFDFCKAYAVTDFGALRGCEARVWSYFNKFSSGMDRWLPWIDRAEGEPMPAWVKPDRPLTADDLKWAMRDHFEGTPYDMTQDVGAGPFGVPYRWRPMEFEVDSVKYVHERAIATQQTGWSFVAQVRGDVPADRRGLLWFGTDDANTCVYLPVFCSVTEVPSQLGPGDINTFDRNSNFWMNSLVANQAYNRYSQMIPDIRKVQNGLEKSMSDEVALAWNASDFNANDLLGRWAQKATDDYRDLATFLFVKFMDGNIKKQAPDGSFLRTPEGIPAYPDFGGYDDPRYFENIARTTGDRLKVKPVKY